jgi:pyruvate/2-oxoglutarate/acetoin dehydrogenase E1 component
VIRATDLQGFATVANAHNWKHLARWNGEGYYDLRTEDIGDVPVRLFLTPKLLEATEDIDGASIEVLDLRSLVPLDEEAILASVAKTSKVLIVDEANQTCAAGAQVAAVIAEKGFEDLDGPVRRVATPDVPIPFSPPLEQALLPSVDRVKEAARELLEY